MTKQFNDERASLVASKIKDKIVFKVLEKDFAGCSGTFVLRAEIAGESIIGLIPKSPELKTLDELFQSKQYRDKRAEMISSMAGRLVRCATICEELMRENES